MAYPQRDHAGILRCVQLHTFLQSPQLKQVGAQVHVCPLPQPPSGVQFDAQTGAFVPR